MSLFDIISVVWPPDRNIFLCIPASAADAAAVNPKGINTPLTNGVITLSINTPLANGVITLFIMLLVMGQIICLGILLTVSFLIIDSLKV